MPTIRLKCTKPRHKIKPKQKLKQNFFKKENKKIDIEYTNFINFIKDSDNYNDLKKLIFKQYSSSVDLDKLKMKFKSFYNENNYFKKYCRDNNISYHFLNKTTVITIGSINYKKML